MQKRFDTGSPFEEDHRPSRSPRPAAGAARGPAALVAALLVLAACAAPAPPEASPTPEVPPPAAGGEAEVVEIVGTLTDEGVECPAVAGDDGVLYTLVGEGVHELATGSRLRIVGRRAEVSTCMQGTTIEVVRAVEMPAAQ